MLFSCFLSVIRLLSGRKLLSFSFKMILSYNIYNLLVGHVGKKSHLSCSLDCYGELSLVKSAGTGYASGEDLSSLGNKLSELCYVLVVDSVNLILAEDANLLSSVHRAEGTLCIVSIHSDSPLTFPTHVFCLTRPL